MDVLVWIKELLKFKTANDRLIAALFGAVIAMGTTIGVLYTASQARIEQEEQRRINDRNYYDLIIKQKDHLIAGKDEEIDQARGATLDCERESTQFAKDLLAKQTGFNTESKKVTKTQLSIAVQNRQLIKKSGKQIKMAIDKLK